MKLRSVAVMFLLISLCLSAWAQLPGDPPWRAGAQQFEGRDAVIYADGTPFPLIFDFTWSAELDDRFYEFAQDWGNTATHAPVEAYEPAAANQVFWAWAGSVGHNGAYLRDHPEAAMREPDGSATDRAQVCYLNPGYREFLGAQLTELAQSMRDRPYHLGYYPQDEFSYRTWGCHCEVCVQAFRERMQAQYGTIAALNEAWGADLAGFDTIELPTGFEKSRRFCDWQEFRRWSQLDFAKFVYDTLKANDPDHVVIWSLPFWGGVTTTAAWWDFPQVSDVLMRHGIGYQSGIYRFTQIRDIAEWSGDPANALAMPPDYYPGYVQMSLLMDCPRTGLSHVCIAGAPDPTYQGVADSENGYVRREPLYTVSRAINDQVYQLGDLYLESKQRPAQVGVYVSDRTVLVNGVDIRALNGVLLMLHDLNLDSRVFSEHNLGDLARFPAIIVGPFSRVTNDEIAAQFRDYVAGGGHLIFLDGAFAADWYNQDAGSPGFGFEALIGSNEAERISAATALSVVSANVPTLSGLPEQTPALQQTSVRAVNDAAVVATLADGRPVVTLRAAGEGSVLYIGADLGTTYYSSWSEGYRDVTETNEQAQALDDNAYGYDYRPPTGAEVEPAKGAKAWAQIVRSYLRAAGVGDNVEVAGYTDGIGVLKVKSFRRGDAYWVGLANRLVAPGLDPRQTPSEELNRRLSDLPVRVRLDTDGPAPAVAWLVPNQRRTGGGRAAVPELLALSVEERDGARWANFTLPELIDFATVALLPSGERAAAVGIATDRETMTAGESLTATATVINTSGGAIRGTVTPGLEEGLACADAPAAFALAPGERFTAAFTIAAPAGIEPDYYQINMVARIEGGVEIPSPSVEAQVQRDIIIAVDNERTIFPLGHLEPVLPVSVTVNTVAPAELTVSVELPEGFGVDTPSQALRPLRTGEEQTVSFRFTAQGDTPRVAEGALKVTGTLRGEPFTRSLPIRLAVGAVIYQKEEAYKTHASMVAESMPLVCLENSHVLATIIENNGVVHDLVLRDTNTDHLVPSPYPFGLVWYGFPGGWRRDEISGPGERVFLRLRGTHPDGTPVTMTYTLAEGDNHLLVDIKTNGAGPTEKPFYLMSRIGIDGVGERTIWPTADGLQELAWRGGRRDVPATDLSEHWMAVQDDATGQTFGCVYSFPSLDHVALRPGDSNFNYMIFYPNPNEPIGDIAFALSATLGDVSAVQELYRRLSLP